MANPWDRRRKKKKGGGAFPFSSRDEGAAERAVNITVNLEGQGAYVLASDYVLVGNPASRHVLISPDGGVQVSKGEIDKIQLDSDGDVYIGSDLSDPASTHISIFSEARTYNGESFGAGDLLIGDNSTGKANLFWDKSDGRFNFRGGIATTIYIDTDGTLKAGAFTINDDGVSLIVEDSYFDSRSFDILYDTVSGTKKIGELSGYGGGADVILRARHEDDGEETGLLLESQYNRTPVSATGYASIFMRAREENDSSSEYAFIEIYRDYDDGDQSYVKIGNELRLTGLPTSAPAESGIVWNDSGTLKIS